MGQQQLLIIIAGIVIVGGAVVSGISFFYMNAASANRDAIAIDLNNLATIAWKYKKTPSSLGGGNNSFTGFSIPVGLVNNANGTYSIFSAGSATSVGIQAVGTQIGDNGTSPVKYLCVVTNEAITISKQN